MISVSTEVQLGTKSKDPAPGPSRLTKDLQCLAFLSVLGSSTRLPGPTGDDDGKIGGGELREGVFNGLCGN